MEVHCVNVAGQVFVGETSKAYADLQRKGYYG